MITRRQFGRVAGGALAALASRRPVGAAAPRDIEMRGTARGERVWFAPLAIAVAPGAMLRFVNHDKGNSHTATTYHPAIFDRPRRIPSGAAPWDSDFLLPGASFEVTLSVPGVYDYYCIPHEHAGMVGRIVVGRPGDPGWEGPAGDAGDLPEAALKAFPRVAEILAKGRIMPEDLA
ncbi:hypothetical protein H0I76_03695 [Limibaculum sp. M0105]|uniref:Blue (type 1) copper domain-containing protein n=1 Tax=Thermohalobaculum xanthum TaxID=2753746 RepID=A0A8J7M4T1_9RHOB|nr:plastocyanin/azurin family copper-binding protein [Thermohalobaculum xanthum]MBK0398283.1 hypothetical protein [Thermohalobaculum xanthum]